jgi:hypothetical protein
MNFINFVNKSKTIGDVAEVNLQQTGTRQLKKGEVIRIVYCKDSPYNIYKGYIGEIRDYKKGMDTAVVFLYAVASYKLLILPLEHFVVISSYSNI